MATQPHREPRWVIVNVVVDAAPDRLPLRADQKRFQLISQSAGERRGLVAKLCVEQIAHRACERVRGHEIEPAVRARIVWESSPESFRFAQVSEVLAESKGFEPLVAFTTLISNESGDDADDDLDRQPCRDLPPQPGAHVVPRVDRLASASSGERTRRTELRSSRVSAKGINSRPGSLAVTLGASTRGRLSGVNYVVAADAKDFLAALRDESVDLFLIDPPYFEILNVPWDNQWESAGPLRDVARRSLRRRTPQDQADRIARHVPSDRQAREAPDLRGGERRREVWTFRDWITWKKARAFRKSKGYLFARDEILWFSASADAEAVTLNTPFLDEKPRRPGKFEFKRVSNVWSDIAQEFKPGRSGRLRRRTALGGLGDRAAVVRHGPARLTEKRVGSHHPFRGGPAMTRGPTQRTTRTRAPSATRVDAASVGRSGYFEPSNASNSKPTTEAETVRGSASSSRPSVSPLNGEVVGATIGSRQPETDNASARPRTRTSLRRSNMKHLRVGGDMLLASEYRIVVRYAVVALLPL